MLVLLLLDDDDDDDTADTDDDDDRSDANLSVGNDGIIIIESFCPKLMIAS